MKDKLDEFISLLQDELESLPDGKLYSRRKNGKTYYSRLLDDKLFGITRNDSLVTQLARKKYIEETLPLLMEISHCFHKIEFARKELAALRASVLAGEFCLGISSNAILLSERERLWNKNRQFIF